MTTITEETTTPAGSDPHRRYPDSLLGVLSALFRWKRELLWVVAVAALGSAIISLVLPVYYQASTTFLAISPDQAKPELLFSDNSVDPEIYGGKGDIDRLLTIAESNELIDYLVDSFNLYAHYRIDSSGARAPHYVRKHFLGLYEITKTNRDAIQITIEDKDPELAAAIARAALAKIDQIAQRLIKDNLARALETFRRDIDGKRAELATLNDTMVRLRDSFGVFNPVAQTELLTGLFSQAETKVMSTRAQIEVYQNLGGRYRDSIPKLEARLSGAQREVEVISQQLNRLNNGVSNFLTLERQIQGVNAALSTHQEKSKQYEATYLSDIPATLVVEEAQTPLIKSRPHRSLIVVAATAMAFFFAMIAVLLLEAYRDINWREIYAGR